MIPPYHVGQLFRHTKRDYIYILALIAETSKLTLICLNDGLPWDNAITVKDRNSVSDDEWKIITSGVPNEFKLIELNKAVQLLLNDF